MTQSYLRNRYYSPSIGRFITEDPIKDGLNWYVYCGNNPIKFVDYSGYNYDNVINALDKLCNAKKIMNHTTRGGTAFNSAYQSALEQKETIRNSAVYIENWAELRNTLDPIVNGDNNSQESINAAKEKVIEAKKDYDNRHTWSDILFTAGLTAVVTISIKGGQNLLKGSSIATSPFNFSQSALKHMTEAGRFVPIQILQEAIKSGRAEPDSQGSSATMYYYRYD